jgi:hypothetical protein
MHAGHSIFRLVRLGSSDKRGQLGRPFDRPSVAARVELGPVIVVNVKESTQL